MLDNPKLKLWKASAVVTVYVLAESAEDVDCELEDFVRNEIIDRGCRDPSIREILPTPEEKKKIHYKWLNASPYVAINNEDENEMTVAEFMDEAIAAEAERIKRGPLPGQLSLGLEEES